MNRLTVPAQSVMENGWRRVISDLRYVRPAVVFAIVLLVAGGIGGYILHEPTAESSAEASSPYDFENPTALDIALNNLGVMVVLLAGAITLGAVTVSGLLYNGFVLGSVLKSLMAMGISPFEIGLLILPHAIFELPGLVVAAGIGLTITRNVVYYLLGKRDTVLRRAGLWSLVRLLSVASVLVLTGAMVEIHVTPVVS